MSEGSEKQSGWERFRRSEGKYAAPTPQAPTPQAPTPQAPTPQAPSGKPQKPGGPPSWAAAALIALGVLFFLGNLGILPVHDIWAFWPVFLIAAGIGQITHPRNVSSHLFGIALIIFGASFLLSNFSFAPFRFHNDGGPVPILVVVFGFVALMKAMRRGAPRLPRMRPMPFAPRQAWSPAGHHSGFDYQNEVQDFVLFGSLKRKLETPAFAGGNLTSVFGNIEIDLRRTSISSTPSVALNTTAVFASIKLRVPQNWRVHVSGLSVLGNFEDKTIPPNLGPAAPVLVITGISLFSTVEIED